jgi:CubicO group peptidase (beta-lactamase class C family)
LNGPLKEKYMAILRAAGTIALLVACVVALAPSQRAQLDVEAFRTKIRKILSDGAAPSLAVAVARNGEIVWSEAFGFADREARVPATVETPYSIASLTKPFTATALMILEERRRLDLDEPLSRYLGPLERPGVSAPGEVTLRRILGHVAGFPVHYQYFFDDQPDRPLSFAETMRCYGAEIHKPGSRHSYSNLGFGALGETVARVSGQRYRDFLAREVFAPLGLKGASVPERAEEAVGAAKRYGRDGSLLPFYVTDFTGGSAVFASVEDVVRFGSFHAGALMAGQRAVLTPESLTAMQQKGTGDNGLGWSVNHTWNKHPVIWHSGAMPGAAATLWLVPAEKVAIAVVANQIGASVNQLAGEILADLLPAGQPAAGSRAPEEAKSSTPVPTPSATDHSTGRYRGRLMTCPKPEMLAIDVQRPGELELTVGSESPRLLDGTFTGGRLYTEFSSATGSTKSQFQLDLRLVGNRLEGPVTRRTSVGPRANFAVTIWAELKSER